MKPIFSTVLITFILCFSCTQNQKLGNRELNSELLQKIDAVHQQMMKQGNISEEEKEAIRSLAAMVAGKGIENPYDSSSANYLNSFGEVDIIPTYLGCENESKDEQLQCFINRITKFINAEFNMDVAKKLKLTGTQEIDVFVKIDKNGYPSALKVRDTFVELQAEAVRVLNKIPRMTPASKNGEKVDVVYPDRDIPHTIILEMN
ncbi:energy transducer TonB [Maribacter dokdonensis]|uniref:hypothetical protein n=1 Tax=Maribacter dokdonensis TaxID=320912 RepID=UPI00327024F2